MLRYKTETRPGLVA